VSPDAGPRAAPATERVTREAIARAALALIQADGVGAVTMRAVAERLAIRAPSLYEHVRSKDELLDLLVREAFAGFRSNTEAYGGVRTVDDWIRLVVEGSLQLRAFYLRHPGLAGLMQRKLDPDRDRLGGTRASLVAAQLDALVRIGVPQSVARSVFQATAFWSLAAVAAEGLVEADVDAAAREARYRLGLELITTGVRATLQRALEDAQEEDPR
jgi:TetR/AcrR family transcriptional regulator, tetracycline repressor protein